jgi:hypothetical protein
VADILLLYASTLHWFTCGECPATVAACTFVLGHCFSLLHHWGYLLG